MKTAGTQGIEVLYENENIIVVNKPAGLVVHSDGKTEEYSIGDWIIENRPEMKNVGEPWKTPDGKTIWRPGIVHRLDRETSGVLVLCKTREMFEFMKSKFQKREEKKLYHAFVYGAMKEAYGTINRPIARSKKDFRLWSAQHGARGKEREALTRYRVLKWDAGATFVEVEPKTGRTHQIRVHFKAVNHPVVCDRLYAPRHEPILGFERLALHARSIEFAGMDGTTVRFDAPYPLDFQRAVGLFGA
jgi:23S rRNA pseudouridine1911/1915/1917 synthase